MSLSENEYKLFNLLNKVLTKGRLLNNGEAIFHDPFSNHYKPKLAINLKTQSWHSWIIPTKRGRNFISLFKQLNVTKHLFDELYRILPNVKSYNNKTPLVEEILQLPQEYKPLYKKQRDIEYKHAINYLKRRNLNEYDIIKYNLGYCVEGKYKNRIIIPSYDINGNLNFFSSRSFFKTTMPYLNCEARKDNIVGFELFINYNLPLILCEGPFDAFAIKRNAIPLFGKTLGDKLFYNIIKHGVEKIFLALDIDAMSSIIDIADKLLGENLEVYYINLSKKDPSETGFVDMQKLINQSILLDSGKVIKMRLCKQ
jgi:hypothetical protein